MDNAFDYIQGQMDTRFIATPDDNRPSFGEVVSASIGRAYDPLFEYVKFQSNRSTSFREEGFDPFPQIPDHLNDYSSSLLSAHTQEEFDELVRIAEESLDRRRVLSQASFGQQLGASLFDPINLIAIPLTGGASVGMQALRTGASVGALTAAQEGLIYATDPTATGAEFALNVGAGFAVGSAFGTLGGILSRGSAPAVIRNTTNDIEQAQEAFTPKEGGASLAETVFTRSWLYRAATTIGKRVFQDDTLDDETKRLAYSIFGDNGMRMVAHQNDQVLGTSVFVEQAQYKAELNTLYSELLSVQAKASDTGNMNFYGYPLKPREFNDFINEASRKRIKGEAPTDQFEQQAINQMDEFFNRWETRLKEVGLIGTLPHYERRLDFLKIKMDENLDTLNKIKGKTAKAQAFKDRVSNRIDDYSGQIKEVEETIERLKAEKVMPSNEVKFTPRYWNTAAIEKNREGLKKILVDWFEKNPDGIMWTPENPLARKTFKITLSAREKRADDVINKILDDPDTTSYENAFFGYGKSKHFMHRTLDIPNSLVVDFIVTNPVELMAAYNARVAPRYSFRKKFGADFEEVIDTDENRMMLKGRSIKDIDRTMRDIRVGYDRVMGAALRTPYSRGQRFAQAIKDVATLNYMGSSGITSMTEVGRIMAEHGVFKTMKALGGLISDEKVRVSSREAAKAGEALEGRLFSASTRLSDDAIGNPLTHNMWSKGKDVFYMLNLLTPVTRELKRLDGVLRQDHLLNLAIKEAKTPNKITKAEKEYLRRYNISVEDSKKLSEMPIERGESGLIYANTDEWPDEALKTTFQRSMSSGILNTIMQATPSDRPIMADGIALIPTRIGKRFGLKEDPKFKGYSRIENGLLSLPFQFYSFTLAALNKTTAAYGTGQMKSQIWGTLWMMGLGYMVLEYKTPDWLEMSIQDKLLRSFDYSGAAALYSDIYYTSMATSLALSGKNYAGLGVFEPKFPQEQSGIDASLAFAGAGPAIASDYARAMNDMVYGDFGEGAKDFIRRMPFMQLWFMKGFVNEHTRALGEGLGDDIPIFGRY